MNVLKYWIDKEDLNNKYINSKFNYIDEYGEKIWEQLGLLIHNNYTTTLPLYSAYKLLEYEEFFYIFNLSYYMNKYNEKCYLILDKQFYIPFIEFIFDITLKNSNNELFGKYIDNEIKLKNEIIKKENFKNKVYEIKESIISKLRNSNSIDFNEIFNLIYRMHYQDLECILNKIETVKNINNTKIYKNILKNTIMNKYLLDNQIFEKYLFKIDYKKE